MVVWRSAFDTGAFNFKERKVVSKEKHEILCVTGTVGKIKTQVVVFVIYVPPNTTAGRLSDLNDVLGKAVAAVKIAHGDPIMFVTGDLNGRNIEPAFDINFPLQTIRARSNEDPWITNGIRRRAKRKKRLYKRTGRSEAWKRADLRLEREVAKKKQEFVDMLADAPGKSYFSAVKKLSGHTAKKTWEVSSLFPDAGPGEVGSIILDYFASVRGNDPPSTWPHIPLDGRVEDLLRCHKRVKSKVDGDPLPHLVHKFPGLFACWE